MFLSKSLETSLIDKKLKNYDSHYKNFIFYCSNALVFKFDAVASEWRQEQADGTFFIYKSTDSQSFGLKQSNTNFYNVLILSRALTNTHFHLKFKSGKVDLVNGLVILSLENKNEHDGWDHFGFWLETEMREKIYSFLNEIVCQNHNN